MHCAVSELLLPHSPDASDPKPFQIVECGILEVQRDAGGSPSSSCRLFLQATVEDLVE